MVSLRRHVIVVAVALVACKDTAPSAKPFDGPTFTVSSTLRGPETKQRDLDGAPGKTQMSMYVFSDPSDPNTAQMVQTTPMAITDVPKAMTDTMDGTTANVHATVDDKRTLSVAGTSMLDFTGHFTDADGTFFLRGRVAVKGGLLYQALAMGTGTKPTASANTFIDTFVVK